MPQVSVIIPCYNGQQYISQAIESVLDQTFHDFEIVVTNDGSTDSSVRRIEDFGDPRIRLYNFERNRGVAAATNHCIEHAEGDYLAILDDDNVFLPSKLERQVKLLEEQPQIGAVLTWTRLIDDAGSDLNNSTHPYNSLFEQPNRTRQEWLHHFFYRNNCLCHPSAMIRRQCYERVGTYDTRLSQLLDFDLWIRLCRHYEIFILPEKLLKFRIHDDDSNLSGQSLGAQARHDWQASKVLNNYLAISSARELLEIFPEAERFGTLLVNDLIPYYLAVLAFDSNYAPAKLWALNTLYEMFGGPLAEKLREDAGFEENDLIQMSSDPDIFDLERRIRELRIQLHEQENVSHRQTNMIQQQQRQIESMKNSWSWCVTRPLRRVQKHGRRVLGKGGRKRVIHLECDRITYSSQSLDVSGWALSEAGIDRIEIYLDGSLLGEATYGIVREDIRTVYPSVSHSRDSGFHLNVEVPNLRRKAEPRAVIKAIDHDGQGREVSIVLR